MILHVHMYIPSYDNGDQEDQGRVVEEAPDGGAQEVCHQPQAELWNYCCRERA